MKPSNLKLVIFRPPVVKHAVKEFECFYAFWKDCWTKANIEMGKDPQFPSDAITRQHEILVLFDGERPIASTCNRYADLSSQSTYDDSYFAGSWSPKEIDFLKARGGMVMLGSQITIDPAYRKAVNDVGMKNLILFLSLRQAEMQGVDIILGRMRLDRGMAAMCYESGAECLAKDAPYFDAKVDLVAWYPKTKGLTIPAPLEFEIASLLKTSTVSRELKAAA